MRDLIGRYVLQEERSLDDDEDRRNPAFVPRRGGFYMHDLRIMQDADEDKQTYCKCTDKSNPL